MDWTWSLAVDSDAHWHTKGRRYAAAAVAAAGDASGNSSATHEAGIPILMSDNDVHLPRGTWVQLATCTRAGKEAGPEARIDVANPVHTRQHSLHAGHSHTNTLD